MDGSHLNVECAVCARQLTEAVISVENRCSLIWGECWAVVKAVYPAAQQGMAVVESEAQVVKAEELEVLEGLDCVL